MSYQFKSKDEHGKEISLQFLSETQSIREQCELAYAKAFKYYFTNGVMTRAQSLDIARSNGVLDEEWQENMKSVTFKLSDKIKELNDEETKKRPNKVKIEKMKGEVLKLRVKYNRLTDRQNDILQYTCESFAENCQIEMSIVLRTADEDGKCIFKDHKDFLERVGSRTGQDAMQHIICLRAGVPYDVIAKYGD